MFPLYALNPVECQDIGYRRSGINHSSLFRTIKNMNLLDQARRRVFRQFFLVLIIGFVAIGTIGCISVPLLVSVTHKHEAESTKENREGNEAIMRKLEAMEKRMEKMERKLDAQSGH